MAESDGYNSGYDSVLIWSDDPEDAYFKSMQQAGAIETDSMMGDSTLADMMDAPTINHSEPRDEIGDGLSWGVQTGNIGDKRSRLGGATGGQPQGQHGWEASESSLSYAMPSTHTGRSTTDSMGFSMAGSRSSSNTSQTTSTGKRSLEADGQSTTDSLGFSHSSGMPNRAPNGTVNSSEHGHSRSSDLTGIKTGVHAYPDSIGTGNSNANPPNQIGATNVPNGVQINASQHSTTDSLGFSRTSDLTGIKSASTKNSMVPESIIEQDTQSTADSSLGMGMSHHTNMAAGRNPTSERDVISTTDSLGFGGASTMSMSKTSSKPAFVDPNGEVDVQSKADSNGFSRSTGTVYTTTDATVSSLEHGSVADSYGFNRTKTLPAKKSDNVDPVAETPVMANRPPMQPADVASTKDSYGFGRSRTVPVNTANDSAAPTPVMANRSPMRPAADAPSTTDSYGFTAANGTEHSIRTASLASTMQGSHLQRPEPERAAQAHSPDKENSKRSAMSDSYGFVRSETMPKSNKSPQKSRTVDADGNAWSALLGRSYDKSTMPDSNVETPTPNTPKTETPVIDHRETIEGTPTSGRPPVSPSARSPSNGSKMSDSYGFWRTAQGTANAPTKQSGGNKTSPPRQIFTTNDREQDSNVSNLAVASSVGEAFGLVRSGTVQPDSKTSPDSDPENMARTRSMSHDESIEVSLPWPQNAENSVMASTLSNPSAVKPRDLAGKASADAAAGSEKPPPPGFIYLCGGNPAQDPEAPDKSPEEARGRRNNRLFFLKLALVILVLAVSAAIAMLILIIQESDKQDEAALGLNAAPTVPPVTFPPAWIPTAAPSMSPSMVPTMEFVPPTVSANPTRITREPTAAPTRGPPTTARPTVRRTPRPSTSPTQYPTKEPTPNPTKEPTPNPTPGPTPPPTPGPTPKPTPGPTPLPTPLPTTSPVLETQTANPTTNGALMSATRGRLIVGSPQSSGSLSNTASPQFRALDWMVNLDVNVAGLSDAELLQRWMAVTTYYSFGGETWANSNFWLSNFNECGWNGITCDVNGRVTGIVLSSNNLQGTMPMEISLATNLENLRLDNNNIQGELPSKLGLFSNLISLKVNGNQISGSLPPQLGNLSRLKELALNDNDLTGTVPTEFSGMTAMERLDLSYNRLNGDMPASIESLSALTSLKIERNRVVGNIPSGFCTRSPRVQLAADCEEVSCPCCTDCCVDDLGCVGILEMPSAQPSPNPTAAQTANPTVKPVTPSPTAVPVTPSPTVTPATPSPTAVPITPAPTVTPVTPSPTVTPATPAPTVTPVTPSPTVTPATPAPTVASVTPAPSVATPAPTVAQVTSAPTTASITLAPTVAPVASNAVISTPVSVPVVTPSPTVLTPSPTVVTPSPMVVTPSPTTAPITTIPVSVPVFTPSPTTAPITTIPVSVPVFTPSPTTAPITTIPVSVPVFTPSPTTAPFTTIPVSVPVFTPSPTTAPFTTIPVSVPVAPPA